MNFGILYDNKNIGKKQMGDASEKFLNELETCYKEIDKYNDKLDPLLEEHLLKARHLLSIPIPAIINSLVKFSVYLTFAATDNHDSWLKDGAEVDFLQELHFRYIKQQFTLKSVKSFLENLTDKEKKEAREFGKMMEKIKKMEVEQDMEK